MLLCIEFCDRFLPYASLTANEGLLLHTFTLQLRDSTCDSSLFAYPVALWYELKYSIITETSCINGSNAAENLSKPSKVCSKIHNTFISIILCL